MVRGPAPQSSCTGSGRSRVVTSAAGQCSSPSGFARPDSSFAIDFVGPTPTEHGSPSSERTRMRIAAPIAGGSPKSCTAPPTSRNASSSDSGSTSGVTSRSTAIRWSETSR